MNKKQYSKNRRAEKVMGKRNFPDNAIPFDWPAELGYHCPICQYSIINQGNYDERLDWSEYNGFLWCSVCNKDYPSCMCIPLDKELPGYLIRKYGIKSTVDYAIKTFLDSVEYAKESSVLKETGGVG